MRKVLLSLVLAAAWISPAFAGTADDIIKKAHLAAYYAGKDGGAQLLMKVYQKGAAKPISKLFYMLKLDVEEGGQQRFFVYFVRPSDIRRTSFLVHKFIDKDDFRRLYIPASDKVLAIAGSRKQDPFMGSDFSYEDVSGRHHTRDTHRLLGEETLEGRKVHVTESVPKEKEPKTAKMKAWIDAATYLPLKVEFYNHDGKVYKVYTSEKIVDVQGFPTIMKRTMVSPLEGTRTEILVNPKKVQYDLGLTEGLFSERSLRNPPMRYLK
jgi:outer membrane lipoprotein-sorting protein